MLKEIKKLRIEGFLAIKTPFPAVACRLRPTDRPGYKVFDLPRDLVIQRYLHLVCLFFGLATGLRRGPAYPGPGYQESSVVRTPFHSGVQFREVATPAYAERIDNATSCYRTGTSR